MKKFKFFTTIAVVCWLFFSFVLPVGAQGGCTGREVPNGTCVVNSPHGCSNQYSPKLISGPPSCNCDCVKGGGGISNPAIDGEISGLSGAEFLNKLISLGISVGFLVAAVIFVYMFIMGGIRWITSEGDKTKVETARNQITHALVGLLLTFLLFVILEIIEQFFGISLKELKIPSLTD